MNGTYCSCKSKDPPPDSRAKFWEVKGQDGVKNCTVSQFGPCGVVDGTKIECHGNLKCNDKEKYCFDPEKPVSANDELCGSKKHCKKDLRCNLAIYKCIKPQSTPNGKICHEDNDCESKNCVPTSEQGYVPSKCENFGSGSDKSLVVSHFWLVLICLANKSIIFYSLSTQHI